ncbi:hypothetical protein [Phenylobacterium sp.]|uniref:hypothetical protein n=1 Tax=Phenylobacterium sp. TaxID=1871053 RepID=UPI002811AA0A|nr:hypothetical protein [Phenylobacterium sp.]
MRRVDIYVLRLAPEPDALVRVLTVAARLPGAIRSLSHVEAYTRLEMRGLTFEFGQLLAARLRALPCVSALHYLEGHGPAAQTLDKVAS